MRRMLAFALFGLVFAGYMLTYSRFLDIMADEGAMFAVTESMVKFGRANIDQTNSVQYIWPATIGPDGSRYAKYGLGQSLAAVPLYAIGLAVPVFGLIDLTLLVNPLAGALSAAFLTLAALELGATRRRTLAITLIYAFCTPIWVYSKNFFCEALAALGFALSCWGIAVLLVRQRVAGALLAGLGIGVAVMARTSTAVAIPVLLFVVWRYGGARRRWLTLAAAAPAVAAVIAVCLYNWTRFGSVFHTGYGAESFDVFPLIGAWGMLFSPGRSLFIYAPIMLVAIPGLWKLRRPAGLRAWLLATISAVLLIHGAWWSWWGGWSWGPRLLVAMLPLLSLGLLTPEARRPQLPRCTVEGARPTGAVPAYRRGMVLRQQFTRPGIAMSAVGLLAGLGFLVQVPGVAVNRVYFFGDILRAIPDAIADEVPLYTFRFFMPLTNLRRVLYGSLDLAWKPGLGAAFDPAGLLLASLALLIGATGLALAWRGGRVGCTAAWLGPLLVLAITAGSLARYQCNDYNPYGELGAIVAAYTGPDAVIFVGDHELETNQQFWNVNRTRRHFVGVASNPQQMQKYTLPAAERAVQAGRELWYLQIDGNPPEAFPDALRRWSCAQRATL